MCILLFFLERLFILLEQRRGYGLLSFRNHGRSQARRPAGAGKQADEPDDQLITVAHRPRRLGDEMMGGGGRGELEEDGHCGEETKGCDG